MTYHKYKDNNYSYINNIFSLGNKQKKKINIFRNMFSKVQNIHLLKFILPEMLTF